MAVSSLLVGVCLFLLGPVLAVSIEKGNISQLLDKINRRQAIPLAVVQVSTFRIFPHQNKKTDNEKIAAPVSDLEKRLQNYSPFIKKQAQQDIRLRELGGKLNITESLYNGSIAFAIDNNKTTAVYNNTIHLLQSFVLSENQKNMMVSLSEVSNKTIEKKNKTITIQMTDLTPDLRNTPTNKFNNYQQNMSHNESTIFLPIIKNITKQEATILSDVKNITNNNSIVILTDIKNDTTYANNNSSYIEKLNVLENKENLQAKVKTSESMHSSLPQFTNIYYMNKFEINNSSNNSKQEVRIKETTEEQGVLVGPLDTLPNYPNGNGPQDKKLKDLGTPGKTGLGSSKKGKKLGKEVKVRKKRQLYNFRGPGMHMPWDYAIDSEQFENNGNVNEQNNDFFVPSSPKQNLFLKSLYETSTNAYNNLARDSVARNQWSPNNYLLNNQFSETPKQNYNEFLEHEATLVDKHTSPIIGSFYNTENLMQRTNQPKFHSPLIVDEDANDENEIQRSFQKTFIPVNKFNLDPSTFSNEYVANYNDATNSALEHYNVRPNPRDQIIETFLNNYDQETKKMADFYKQQALKNSLDFSRINPESLTDPDVNLNQYRSEELRDSYFNTQLSHEGVYPDATSYQDQRRDLLQRRTEKPFELDIHARIQPSYFPSYNLRRYLSHPIIDKEREFLQNPYPYKRTMESIQPSLLPSLGESNLLSSRYSPVDMLTLQRAVALNLVTPNSYGGDIIGDKQLRSDITNQQGVVMLMVTTPVMDDDENERVPIEHKELTRDGITRLSSNVTNDDGDFSINLKKAADFVLTNAVSQGNITVKQRDAIERKLNIILEKRYKNRTRVEMSEITRVNIPRICEDTISDCKQLKIGGVCPFMITFMKGTCTKTCSDCSSSQVLGSETVKGFFKHPEYIEEHRAFTGVQRSLIESISQRKFIIKTLKIPDDPVMYLTFEYTNQDGIIEDSSLNKNNALLEKGASLSPRVLGTCGKAVELNEGSVTWSGEEFKRKPDVAISIAMYVKVKKSGVINWFANGKTGDKKFYAKTKKTVVPAKIWTHVAGTYDSDSGLARIYINGELEQEQTQRKGEKLSKDWLVNGIGAGFGDDSLHYADEVLIYDRALTQSEIKMLFNRCTFNRMILHFGFQKGNKTSMSDQSGLDNDAILVGGARQKEDGQKCGYCLDLTNGPDPAMKIEQIAVKKLPRTKISLALWINLNSTNGIHNIFTTESSEGNIGYRLQVVNGRVRWAIGTDTVPVLFDHMTESQVIPEASWAHIVTTYNNENGIVKIYINSKEKLKEVVPDERREFLPTNWDNDASIGDRTFRGYIDEFIMYNWDLDSSEALYVRNYCADHPKLVRFTVRVPLTKKTVVPHSIDNKLETRDNNPIMYRNEFVNARAYVNPSLKTLKFEQNRKQTNLQGNISKTLHSKDPSSKKPSFDDFQAKYKKGFIFHNKDTIKKLFLEKKRAKRKY